MPTIPCDAGAMELLAAGRPLPAGAFAARGSGDGAAVAAWPADPGAGFAVPFDLVASAFVLLACWDERTTDERDKYGRLPYSASVFAAQPRADASTSRPWTATSSCCAAPWRRASPSSASSRCRPPGASGERAAASPSRSPTTSTTCGGGPGAASPPPATAPPARPGTCEGRAVVRELGDGADWLVRHLPRRTDPFWTFPQILARRGRARRLLDLLRDRPPHAQAGRQPAGDVPHADPRGARSCVTDAGREVGLHGNDADRLALAELARRPRRARPDARAAPSPASATTTCARSTTRRCRCSSRPASPTTPPWPSPSTRASAAAARSRSGRTRLAEERPLDLVELPLAVMDGTLQEPHYRGLAAADAERRRRLGAGPRPAQRRRGEPALAQQPLRPARLARLRQGLLAPASTRRWRTAPGAASAADVVARWKEATA